ncbi:20781_t:CDS:2 [Dentiscutata erythropus]|uniref:20781_t:CDS:1 n=1 Tax=Dentiscutata erythropus TaxID=1348616 RepID=A0A9N9NKR8_9GLOM|nr:20781_t:CDS:2 [Dentiscutata erythropus]
MGQTSNTSSSSSNFNAYNHDQINSSSSSHYEHNIANTSSFYPNAYEHYNNVNTLPSHYPGPYEYDSVKSTYINIQSFSDMLAGSDVEAQSEDNEYEDNEYEDSEYEYSENEEEGKNNLLALYEGIKFNTWKLAELYLTDYAKQERRRIYECSHAQICEPEKAVLAEDRRDRDSKMIDYPWYINLAFPKTEKDVHINSILGKYNHKMNMLVTETTPKYQKLIYEISEKVKFLDYSWKIRLTNPI